MCNRETREDRKQPNNACTRLGVRAAFFGSFLALSFIRFDGESTLHPKRVTPAVRWLSKVKMISESE